MINIENYLSRFIIDEIREKIQEANGNEVFFIGKINAKKIVEQVSVIARGNQFSVPLVEKAAVRSDVIIHNHPSNYLHPSDNDIHIARELSDFGVTNYIVNFTTTFNCSAFANFRPHN